jgi:hypothetical protein
MTIKDYLAEWVEQLAANATVVTVQGSVPAFSMKQSLMRGARERRQCWIYVAHGNPNQNGILKCLFFVTVIVFSKKVCSAYSTF